MNDYIILFGENAKAPLISVQTGRPYVLKIKGCRFEYPPYAEAKLVNNVYLGLRQDVVNEIRALEPDAGPDVIDKVFELVKKHHPLTPDETPVKEMPTVATEDTYCELYIPWLFSRPVKLTLEQEKELIGIICDEYRGKRSKLEKWFKKYREDYSVHCRYKRDADDQDNELVREFYRIHGLNPYWIDGYGDYGFTAENISYCWGKSFLILLGMLASIFVGVLIVIFIYNQIWMFIDNKDWPFIAMLVIVLINFAAAIYYATKYATKPEVVPVKVKLKATGNQVLVSAIAVLIFMLPFVFIGLADLNCVPWWLSLIFCVLAACAFGLVYGGGFKWLGKLGGV